MMKEKLSTTNLVPTSHEILATTGAKRATRASRRWVVPAVLAGSDALLATLIWGVASLVYAVVRWGELSEATVSAMMPIIAAWVGTRALMGMYPGYGMDAVEELRRHTYATVTTVAALAIFAFGFQFGDLLSRLVTALTFVGMLIFAPFVRHLAKYALKRVRLWGKPVVVLSYKGTGNTVVGSLREMWELGYEPVAVFDFRLDAPGGPSEPVDGEETLADVVGLARSQGVDTAIFAMPYTRREQLAKLVSQASISFSHVLVIPNLDGVTNSAVVARSLGGTFAVEIKYNLLNPWALRIKRLMDVCATVVGGILVLPFLLVLALLVYLESGRPIFYTDQRMGRDDNLFSCVKFRTMVPDAEKLLWQVLENDEEMRREYARYHKLRSDPRVTRVGRFLRMTSLDELPQLWNVLNGEMSLVGPRPYLPRESEEIGVAQSEILRVPPGMTGPWQVSGRNYASFEDRTRMDAHYVHDWSVWLDLVLLARTARTVLFGRGAY